MRSRTVLSAAFVTTAVAPVMAIPTAPHDIAEFFSAKNTSVDERSPPSYGIGPVLVPGFCSETGGCKRQDIASVLDDTVQQGLINQAKAKALLQAVQGLGKRQAYMNALYNLLNNNGLSAMDKRQEYMDNLHNLLNNPGLNGMSKRQAYMNALHDPLNNNGLSGMDKRQEYMNNLYNLLNNNGLSGMDKRQEYMDNLHDLLNIPGWSSLYEASVSRRNWLDDAIVGVTESGQKRGVDLD